MLVRTSKERHVTLSSTPSFTQWGTSMNRFAFVVLSLLALGASLRAEEVEPGLVGEYFASPKPLSDFMTIAPGTKPFFVRVDKKVDFDSVPAEFYGTKLDDNFYVRWTGVLRAAAAGKYEFFTSSDDGSRLFIDGKLVVDNGGPHGMGEKLGATELTAGDHELKIEFFEGGVTAGCIVGWTPPGGTKEAINEKVLFHKKGSEKIEWDEVAWKATKKKTPPAAKVKNGRWNEMDYGSLLSANFGAGGDNWAIKGVAVRLSKDPEINVCFDTELLRISAAWTGGFIDWAGTPFDGSHGAGPNIRGAIKYTTTRSPGWARDGEFKDPRAEKDGVLPATWARYKGLYRHGDNVIFSYTVGDCKVLEMPGAQVVDGITGFSRTFNFGPTTKAQTMVVMEEDGGKGLIRDDGKNIVEYESNLGKVAAGLAGDMHGSELQVMGSRIIAIIPAHAAPISLKLVIANLEGNDRDKFLPLLKTTAENLEPLTKGGPAKWTEAVVTKGVLGTGEGPYVVDTLTAPEENPWKSWLRFGGMDFFADGKRAALSTWSGDVWIVSGIDEKLENLTWKRFATGLFQPLGLKIVNDEVYVLGRDQITRLKDLNNDGEADFYECFNNDCTVTTGFHEFCFDLQTDPEGNFYYCKGSPVNPGGRGFGRISANNGCIMKISKDGSKSEVFATGLRAPNGMGIGPNGEVTTGDNQGTWVPECPINWVKKGGFLGVVDSAHREEKPTKRDDPICWMPMWADNSSGAQVWVTSDKWGPFKGQMLHTSYGTCSLFKVMYEEVGGTIQGGVTRFPVNFLSGTNRPRFNPVDGQLYISGLRGWQTTANKDACFQRVRYTGKPVTMPTEIHVTKTGVNFTFTNPVDKVTATDLANFSVKQFNVHWTQTYGSDAYSVIDPNKKWPQTNPQAGDDVSVASAKLSEDGKTLSLEIPGIKPVNNMCIRYKIKSADGTELKQEIYNTINVVP